MKQFIKISLSLFVMQIVVAAAMPTSTQKDPLYDFFLDQYNDKFATMMLGYQSIRIELLEKTIAFLETNMKSGDVKIDADSWQKLTNDVAQVTMSFDKLKADKANCLLANDISQQTSELLERTRELRNKYDELSAEEEKLHDENEIAAKKIIEEITAEIEKQAPALIEKYVAGLDEEEKQKFDSLMADYGGKVYLVLATIYQSKAISDETIFTSQCADVRNVVAILSIMTTKH